MEKTLQQIRYKKVRQKLRYLQSELEETKMIYQVCLDKFNEDFSTYMQDGPNEVVTGDSEKIKYDKLDTDVSEETIKDVNGLLTWFVNIFNASSSSNYSFC